jgi:hypothetical protein
VVTLALLSFLVPSAAQAKFPPEGADQAPPGVTVTGLGFAPAQRGAARQAVRDARRRALAIASTLGLELGEAKGIELPDLNQFGLRRPCRTGRQPSRCRPGPRAAAATVTFAIAGGSSGESDARWVEASGTASSPVRPRDRSSSRSIKRAALAVRRDLAPQATAVARNQARTAAAAAGLRLGAIVSISEVASYYYGPSFYDAALGSFGPGRFCGIVRQPIIRRDPETGIPKVVRRVPRRRCFIPTPYSVKFEVRYEAQHSS